MMNDDLWNFAAACYAEPGAEAACLELQTAGADVCLMLAGAWLECRGVACDATRLAQLKCVSDDWQTEVVAPLRNVRQAWRKWAALDSDLADLRERLKKLELDAEHLQLQRLQHAARNWTAQSRSSDWLDRLCAGLGGETRAPVDVLRRAATGQFIVGEG